MPLNAFQDFLVFSKIADVANYMADTLQIIPIASLKDWIQQQRGMTDDLTPQQQAMQLFHIEFIEAYIKAREYAQNNADQQITNN